MAEPLPEPLARRVRSGDWQRLRGFRCSIGAWYEDDVERFVATRLEQHVASRAPHLDTSVVILCDPNAENDIWALAVHEIDDQRTSSGEMVEGSLLIVGAVREDLQGRILDVEPFADGRPVSVGRYLLEAVLDALPHRAGAVRAVVAKENERSLRLCDRLGLVHEAPDADQRFVQRLGRIG